MESFSKEFRILIWLVDRGLITVSVSGKQYVTSDKIIENNDIITIDLSPEVGNIWGDYARTIIVENGCRFVKHVLHGG